MGDRAKYITRAKEDPKEIARVIDKYFTDMDAREPIAVAVGKNIVLRKPPYTPAGLARALGITTTTLGRYLRGEVAFKGASDENASEILRLMSDARMRVEEHISERGAVGDLDNTTCRIILGMLGGNKCIDDTAEDANNQMAVVVVGTTEQVRQWSR
jgi:hypothetical protein